MLNHWLFNSTKHLKHIFNQKKLIYNDTPQTWEFYDLIKEFYKSLGFYFVKIDADVEKLEKNRVNLLYLIDKGEKAKIAKIYFLGDKKIREKLKPVSWGQSQITDASILVVMCRIDKVDNRYIEKYTN